MRRRLFLRSLSVLGVGLLPAAAFGQVGHSAPGVRVMPAMPPGSVGRPCPPAVLPGFPIGPTTPTDPSAPSQAPAAPDGGTGSPAAGAGFSEAPSAGTGGGATIAPNMMGDLLGARSLAFRGVTLPLAAQFSVTPATRLPTSPGAVDELAAQASGRVLNPNGAPGFVLVHPNSGFITVGTARSPAVSYYPNGLPSFRQDTPAATFVPPATAPINTLLAALAQPEGTLANAVKQQAPAVQTVTVDPVTGQLLPGDQILYTTRVLGSVSDTPIIIPGPGAGGVVGRVKLSEDNNPLPRDRLIFNYDYFDNTPLTPLGQDVNRFQFGFEKTFFAGRASFEARLPFAGTVTSTMTAGMEGTATELGDLRLALKWLGWRSQRVNMSAGVGVSLPTADDVVVNYYDKGRLTNLMMVQNRSVVVEPFLAILLTPNDRLFGQFWTSVSGDTTGSLVLVNPAVAPGGAAGRLYDRLIVTIDTQLGYWVYRSDYGQLRGLAPFVELHWNEGIDVTDPVTFGTGRGFAVGGTDGNSELNLTGGMTAQLRTNMFLAVGASVPLLSGNNRTFDAQFGLRFNWLFGRTARERERGYLVNSY